MAEATCARRLNLPTLLAAVLVLALVLMAVFAPVLAPRDPDAQNLSKSLSGVSAEYPLGADKLGRDTLSRLMYGGRSTLVAALLVVVVSTGLGIPLGLVAGFARGRVDSVISRVFDVLLAFPALLLALVVVAAFGRGVTNAVISLAIVYVPMIARLVRSATLVEADLAYVEAARALGYGRLRIMFRHILPNIMPLVIVQATVDFAYSILDLAALSFLGLGVQPPAADWGTMVADGRDQLLRAPLLAVAPGLAIMAAVVGFNLLADGLRSRGDSRAGPA